MLFKFTQVVAKLLLASGTLATSNSRSEAHVARHRASGRSQSPGLPGNSDVSDSGAYNNWAGALLKEPTGTFTYVSGTFVVPSISGTSGAAAAWVGIDGGTCQSASFIAGIEFGIDAYGNTFYEALCGRYPEEDLIFFSLKVAAGDVIKATVTAYSTVYGEAMVENLTTNQTASAYLTSSHALCEQNAAWVIQIVPEKNATQAAPLVDFTTLTFSDAVAYGPSQVLYKPFGAFIENIEQNGKILTSVSTDSDIVNIQYV